jgi:hypothetical protein
MLGDNLLRECENGRWVIDIQGNWAYSGVRAGRLVQNILPAARGVAGLNCASE